MFKVFAHGFVPKDPHYSTTGKSPALNFSIGSSIGKGEEKKVDFLNCVLFGKRAEALHPFIKKGTNLVASGDLRSNDYEKEGEKVKGYQLVIDSVSFVGGNKKPTAEAETQADDIPF